MALTERERMTLFQGLTRMIEDEGAVGQMLSYFPTRDVDEPATKELVRTEIAQLEVRLLEQMAATQRTFIQWTLGAMLSLMALVLAMGFLRAP